jgi:hypothetical protein
VRSFAICALTLLAAGCASKASPCGPTEGGARPDAADAGNADDVVVNSPPPVDFVDGTRLHAIAYATPGGGKAFSGWRDTARNETCRFVRAGDGKLRCLPEHRIAGFFADQTCSKPVLYNSCPTIPAYASVGRDECGARIFPLTGDPAPLPLFEMRDGMCGGIFPAPNLDLWASGPEEPPEAFVAAEELLAPGGPTLMMRHYLAEDGAKQVVGPYDPVTQRPCSPTTSTELLCLPTPLVTTDIEFPLYSDADCTTRVVLVPPGCTADAPPSDLVAQAASSDRCEFNYVFHRIGAVVANRAFYGHSGGPNTCKPIPDNAVRPGVYALLGARYVIEHPPRLKTTIEAGSGRLRVRYLEDEAGNKLMARGLYDSVAKTTCTPTAVGGDVRCLPDAYTSVYVDDACTHAVYAGALPVPDFACEEQPTPAFVTSHDDLLCELGWMKVNRRYWSVGKAIDPGTVYERFGDVCVKSDNTAFTYNELTELPISEAPALRAD